MNVNAVSMSSNGLELQGSEILTNPSVSRIRPRADNKVDIGSASKRIKTLFYTTLDPLPGGGVGPFLPLNGSSAMAGTLAMGTNNISNIGTISGATNSRIADNILSNAGTGVAGNLPTFVSAKVIGDSGTALSSLATTSVMTTADNLRLLKAGDTMSGALAMGTNNITNVGSLSGATNSTIVDYIVSNIGGGGLGRVAIFSSNKVIQDGGVLLADLATNTGVLATFLTKTGGTLTGALSMSGSNITNVGTLNSKVAADLVTGPVSSTNNELAVYSGITGKIISASGIPSSNVALTTGSTYTGALAMGANGVTGTGANSAGSYAAASTTDSSSVSTGAITTLGGVGISKKAFIGSNTVIGPTQTITLENMLTLRGPATQALTGPHITSYVSTNQFPVSQLLNWAHDSVSLSFDAYYDGSWRSGSLNSNFQFTKGPAFLAFNYSAGTAAGNPITFLTAGNIQSSTGNLEWNNTLATAQNLSIGAISGTYGGGLGGCISINNASAVPTTSNSTGGILYSQGGALKWRGSSGTITTIAAA